MSGCSGPRTFSELKHRAIFGLRFGVFAFALERDRQIITASERVGVFRSKNLLPELKHRAIFGLRFGVFCLRRSATARLLRLVSVSGCSPPRTFSLRLSTARYSASASAYFAFAKARPLDYYGYRAFRGVPLQEPFPELKHRAMLGLRFGVFAFALEHHRQIITATERIGLLRSKNLSLSLTTARYSASASAYLPSP